MIKGRRIFYLAIFFVVSTLLAAFIAMGKRDYHGSGGGLEVERALGAAAIAEELAAVARSQLDSLSGDDKKDVEALVSALEERAAHVRRRLRDSDGAEELDKAAADLHDLLSEIIQDYKPSP